MQALLGDSNPMVVANAVAALAEIAEVSGKDVLQVTRESIRKLLRALNECTEWGQARDVATHPTIFLASTHSSSVTGRTDDIESCRRL